MRPPARMPIRLAVTMGDPRGVGPEVIVKALGSRKLPGDLGLLIVGSMAVLQDAAGRLGAGVAAARLTRAQWDAGNYGEPRCHVVLDLDNFPLDRLEPRQPDALSGHASLEYIECAVELALDGNTHAVVTAPISKEAIAAAGKPFPGHTEMLAHLTGSGRPVMLLVTPELKVALVTTHIALRDVPEAVGTADIVEAAQAVASGLERYFGVSRPRLAVCGLNPHCGDGGRFGDEEEQIVGPAVEKARLLGVNLCGPRSADTVFAQALRGEYDAVLALYHDQGMIPVKLAGFNRVVNVTLGLPFVRTSVGHGTAYDIAGTGRADETSLIEAIRLAAEMVRASSPPAGGSR